MSDQPEEVTVTDNGDGTQTIHVTATLHAVASPGNEEDA